jgi:hypothetical protein
MRSQAALAGLQCQLAIRRYELLNQSLPANLDAAITGTPLDKVPLDPYANEPMKFVLLDGTPTVYALGKDRRDDGGTVDWKYGQQPGDFLFAMTPLPTTNTKADAKPERSAARVWTSTVGTKIKAEFVEMQGDLVILRKSDGSQLSVNLSQLSPDDQQWLSQQN